MDKFLVHWTFIVLSAVLLAGCTSGGSSTEDDDSDATFGALPTGLPVFAEINEPYISTSSDGDSLSLFSYKEQASAFVNATETEIFSASTDIIVALNTVADDMGKTEFTLLAKNDNVYVVNHDNNQIRLLSHFVNKVCEIIPTEVVAKREVKDNNDNVIEQYFNVLHGDLVYVMTSEPTSVDASSDDDCTSDSKKRFYALPLDHQLDPSLDEDGELDTLALVKESKARAKLILGWQPSNSNPSQDDLTYGYLGFSVEDQELSLFDEEGELVGTQDRELQRFEQVAIAPKTLSDKYIFHVQELDNQQYLIQLGLDVFVVDGGTDLLSKRFDEVDDILSDKTMRVDIKLSSDDVEYALPVTALYDNDDLLLIDGAKIYRLNYQDNVPARVPAVAVTEIIPQNPVKFDGQEYLSTIGFSQFDLKPCDSDDNDCLVAHDVEAPSWQFLTRCESQYGCTSTTELNDPENDAEIIAYMQYAEKYSRHLDYTLHNNRLFITAKMNEKDIFLAYDFNQDFSAAKSLREQVLFGERASLYGMEAYFSNDNLFITALQLGALRSNECYKDGLKVPCDLSQFINSGGSTCTGRDLLENLCTNQFNEYESKAIFCTATQVTDLSCSDAALSQLDNLAVEEADEDAKWLQLYDYISNSYQMFLLVGDHSLALETGNLDEGKLYAPKLFSIDSSSGQKDTELASMAGPVESVVGGWLFKPLPDSSVSSEFAEVLGRVNVLAAEIDQTSSTQSAIQSKFATYMLEHTFENSLSTEADDIKAPKVAEIFFERL